MIQVNFGHARFGHAISLTITDGGVKVSMAFFSETLARVLKLDDFAVAYSPELAALVKPVVEHVERLAAASLGPIAEPATEGFSSAAPAERPAEAPPQAGTAINDFLAPGGTQA